MGLQTNKDDDYNANLVLEKMMKQFEIDIDDQETEEADEDNERINRRREKIKKERE